MSQVVSHHSSFRVIIYRAFPSSSSLFSTLFTCLVFRVYYERVWGSVRDRQVYILPPFVSISFSFYIGLSGHCFSFPPIAKLPFLLHKGQKNLHTIHSITDAMEPHLTFFVPDTRSNFMVFYGRVNFWLPFVADRRPLPRSYPNEWYVALSFIPPAVDYWFRYFLNKIYFTATCSTLFCCSSLICCCPLHSLLQEVNLKIDRFHSQAGVNGFVNSQTPSDQLTSFPTLPLCHLPDIFQAILLN